MPYGLVVLGIRLDDVKYEEEKFIIISSDVVPLFGLHTIRKFGLLKNILEIANDSKRFINENEKIFKGLGKFPNKVKLVLKENAQPIARPPRRIPIAIKDKVKAALDQLKRNEIIERCNEPTDWVSNMVVV